jgi:hypothetical protein
MRLASQSTTTQPRRTTARPPNSNRVSIQRRVAHFRRLPQLYQREGGSQWTVSAADARPARRESPEAAAAGRRRSDYTTRTACSARRIDRRAGSTCSRRAGPHAATPARAGACSAAYLFGAVLMMPPAARRAVAAERKPLEAVARPVATCGIERKFSQNLGNPARIRTVTPYSCLHSVLIAAPLEERIQSIKGNCNV